MKSVMISVAGAFVLCLLGTSGASAAQSARPQKDVTADEAIACIKAAVAAKPGRVKDLEIDIENGKVICEVEVVASDTKKYEVHVDIAANKVVRIED